MLRTIVLVVAVLLAGLVALVLFAGFGGFGTSDGAGEIEGEARPAHVQSGIEAAVRDATEKARAEEVTEEPKQKRKHNGLKRMRSAGAGSERKLVLRKPEMHNWLNLNLND